MYSTYCRLNLPVWASNLDVIRAIRTRLRPEVLCDPAKRENRHAIYRMVLEEHREAGELYHNVTAGTI